MIKKESFRPLTGIMIFKGAPNVKDFLKLEDIVSVPLRGL